MENELRQLIVETLMLDDVEPNDIALEAPLFVQGLGLDSPGLGLDSIDALELAMAIDRRYGVKIRAEDAKTREIFASLKSLAAHVAAHHQKPEAHA